MGSPTKWREVGRCKGADPEVFYPEDDEDRRWLFEDGLSHLLGIVAEHLAKNAAIYGVDIPIRYVAPASYIADVSPDPGANYHFLEHMCPDISRITERLDYHPRFTPEAAMERAVRWMYEQKLV